MTDAERIAQIKANCFTVTNVQVEQITGGFIVTGSINWAEKELNTVQLNKNDRMLATTPHQVAQAILNYYTSGNFDGAAPAPAPVAELDLSSGTTV